MSSSCKVSARSLRQQGPPLVVPMEDLFDLVPLKECFFHHGTMAHHLFYPWRDPSELVPRKECVS